MERKILILGFMFFVFANFLTAQTSFTAETHGFLPADANLEEITTESWSFFADEESNVFYIDFETLKVNLSEVVVNNQNGEVVLKEDVFDLPVNTIYELDCSSLASGTYEVELRSFTGVIRKTISVQ